MVISLEGARRGQRDTARGARNEVCAPRWHAAGGTRHARARPAAQARERSQASQTTHIEGRPGGGRGRARACTRERVNSRRAGAPVGGRTRASWALAGVRATAARAPPAARRSRRAYGALGGGGGEGRAAGAAQGGWREWCRGPPIFWGRSNHIRTWPWPLKCHTKPVQKPPRSRGRSSRPPRTPHPHGHAAAPNPYVTPTSAAAGARARLHHPPASAASNVKAA